MRAIPSSETDGYRKRLQYQVFDVTELLKPVKMKLSSLWETAGMQRLFLRQGVLAEWDRGCSRSQ